MKNYRVEIRFSHDSGYAEESFEFHWFRHASIFFSAMMKENTVAKMALFSLEGTMLAQWDNADTI